MVDASGDLRAWGLQPSPWRTPIPHGPQDVASTLDNALRQAPDQEALVGRYTRYSYRQLDAEVNAAAAGLASLGVKAGDRVAVSAANHPDIVIGFLATQRLGAIWACVGRHLAGPEKVHILKDCEPKVFLADRHVLDGLAAHREDLACIERLVEMEASDPDCEFSRLRGANAGASRPEVVIDPWAPAGISYTSGTTGFPKGVVHSQHNIVLVAAANLHNHAIDFWAPGLRRGIFQSLSILNLYVMSVLPTFLGVGTCICSDRTDALGVSEWLKAERVQTFGCAATTFYDLLTRPDIDPTSLDTLTCVVVGGGPASEELRDLSREKFGRPMIVGYGLTESPGQCGSTSSIHPVPPNSSGRAHPHLEVAALDENDMVLPPGEEGEICVRAIQTGPWAKVYTPMLGYWKNTEATGRALRGGWMHTGDMGKLDADGNLFVQGRKSDVIIRGGANIYAAEVERVLNNMAEVYESAVVGKPDRRLGEVVVGFIQLAPGFARDDAMRAKLAAECTTQLARYKVPIEWIFVDDLPRTPLGKVVKRELKQAHFQEAVAG